MKRIIYIAILTSVISGCLEPSEESLFQSGEQSLVIEGRITDVSAKHEVKVTKTVDGNSDENYEPVENATVNIVDESENHYETLNYVGDGVYQTSDLEGIIGHKYRLEVEYDSVVYTASEQITQTPNFKVAFYELGTTAPYNDGYYIYFLAKVNLDSIGYYKVEVTINDSLLNDYDDLIVFDDEFYKENQILLLPVAFKLYDTVHIQVFSLSNSMYEYYESLSKQTTNQYSNIQPPVVNPSNEYYPDVLGYFQASSVCQIDTVILDSK